MPLSTWEWVIGVNLWGVIHGVRAFVPLLIQQTEAHIVNTASVAGLVAAPFMGPYNASKHAVVAISETLHHELALNAPQVKVSVLCPGWVNTNIAQSARNRPAHLQEGAAPDPEAAALLRGFLEQGMPPDEVANKVLEAIRLALEWTIAERAVFDFLGHPSCLYVTDPDFRSVDLICDLAQRGGAAIVDLGALARRVA